MKGPTMGKVRVVKVLVLVKFLFGFFDSNGIICVNSDATFSSPRKKIIYRGPDLHILRESASDMTQKHL